jgi:lipoic acid synthetase
MVTRDDLVDGGAEHVARTVQAVRTRSPGAGVELLISDLKGNWKALETILAVRPQVLNHNLETVLRLYAQVRPQADYRRSLELLAEAAKHRPPIVTKSGLMLGLGERPEEVMGAMDDLREVGCSLLTLGQYLAPSDKHHAVLRYVTPEEFQEYEKEARNRGFLGVASGPFVRSSYQAERIYQAASGSFNL